MLPKISRLPSSEFLAQGYRTVKTPYFSVKVKPNGGQKNRIGVIISVAAVKNAAKRNFWKRQVKSIIAGRGVDGFDILVILFKQVATATKAKFKEALVGALPKSSLKI